MIKNNNYLDSLPKNLLNDVRDVMEGKKMCKCNNNCSCGKEEKGEKKADDEKAEMKAEAYSHSYNKDAVDKSIKSSRQKIGGKEAKLIHALLKGRDGNKEETKKTFPNVKHFTKDGHPDWKKHGMGEEAEIEESSDNLGDHTLVATRGSGDGNRYELHHKDKNSAVLIRTHKDGRPFKSSYEKHDVMWMGHPLAGKKEINHWMYDTNDVAKFVNKGNLKEAQGSSNRVVPLRKNQKDEWRPASKKDEWRPASKKPRKDFDRNKRTMKDVDKIDEAKAQSPIAGTRLVSKHQGEDGHHAEVRYNPDYEEYQVHHYKNGKHMGEGPVSYHGSGREGREDATDTAKYETKKVSEALEPWMDGSDEPAYLRMAKYNDAVAKKKKAKEDAEQDAKGGGPALRTVKNEEVESIDEISDEMKTRYLVKAWPKRGETVPAKRQPYMQKAREASDRHWDKQKKDNDAAAVQKVLDRTPKVHDLRHMSHGEVYDHTQTSDKIRDGDVLHVKGGSAIMYKAWPTMVHGDSKALHSWDTGHSWDDKDVSHYKRAVDIAKSLKEETLDELNRDTLTRYREKAQRDASQAYLDMDARREKKRDHGASMAAAKMSPNKTHGMPGSWAHGMVPPKKAKIGVQENLVGKQREIDKNKNGKLDKQDFEMLRGGKWKSVSAKGSDGKWASKDVKEETIEEKLNPSMGAAAYIKDFVDSKDPRFDGKTKKERMKQALAAYYAAKNESVETEDFDAIDEAYGNKRDHRPIHIVVDGRYIATTTWAKNAKEAVARFISQHPQHRDARITTTQDR